MWRAVHFQVAHPLTPLDHLRQVGQGSGRALCPVSTMPSASYPWHTGWQAMAGGCQSSVLPLELIEEAFLFPFCLGQGECPKLLPLL